MSSYKLIKQENKQVYFIRSKNNLQDSNSLRNFIKSKMTHMAILSAVDCVYLS